MGRLLLWLFRNGLRLLGVAGLVLLGAYPVMPALIERMAPIAGWAAVGLILAYGGAAIMALFGLTITRRPMPPKSL